jgi:glycine hydroxymethyltransferase
MFYTSHPYAVRPDTNLLDYDAILERAVEVKPKVIIAGSSAYPRHWDYSKMRRIADTVGAYLVTDMAHIAGLVAAGVSPDPFEYSDVVTTTTHKSLRGPRSALIFSRSSLSERVNKAVFPGLQGGPHNAQIASVAVALKEAAGSEFREYSREVVSNAKILSEKLIDRGMKLVTNGTDNHLMLWDARPLGISGSKLERVLELCGVTVNKNTIFGDKNARVPGGVRIGVGAITSRGMGGADMEKIASFLCRGAQIGGAVQRECEGEGGGTEKVSLAEFTRKCETRGDVKSLGKEVAEFCANFGLPGEEMN